VTFHGGDDHYEVRVADDGVGLPDPLPRSSGITNLTNRARQFDGTATWTPNDGGGTLVVWRIPRVGAPDVPEAELLSDDALGLEPSTRPLLDGLDELDGQGNETPVASSDRDHNAAASAVS
jgi:hypothetical protein